MTTACNNEEVIHEQPTEKAHVKLVCGMQVETRAALTANSKELTDLYIMDYDKATGKLLQVLHQTSTATDFAEPDLTLDYGEHTLKVVATRSQEPTLWDAGNITWPIEPNILTPITASPALAAEDGEGPDVPKNIYQWVQSTARQNYYFNRQQMCYAIKNGKIDRNVLIVPTLRTYNDIQIEDVVAKRRWNMEPLDGYDRLAGGDGLARGKVHAVALRANAAVGLARKHRADLDGVDIELLHEVGILGGHHVILGNEDLVRAGLHHVVDRIAAVDALGELFDDLAVLADLADRDAAGRAAVVGADDDILADVDHSAGQITGVCRTKSRIGKALTGASGGGEVFKDGQAFAEVCLDRDLDRLTGGVGHQAAHTGQLTDLLHRTTPTPPPAQITVPKFSMCVGLPSGPTTSVM